jgi:hypothetical protein
MRTTVAGTPHPAWSPTSRLGRWSVVLAGLAVCGTLALAGAFQLGILETAESFSDNWLLTGLGAAQLAVGAGAAVTGVLARVRQHERSALVLAATVLGLLVAMLVLQQVGEGLGWLES